MDEDNQDLEWGLFAARILAGIGLIAAGAMAGILISEAEGPARWGGVGALLGLVAAFGFILSRYRRGDEFDRAIDRVTSVQAGLATIGLIMAQHLFAELGWFAREAVPVFALPGFFILYKTALAQYMRAVLAGGRDFAGLASLRA